MRSRSASNDTADLAPLTGPVLGMRYPTKPFRAYDDRIVDLALHRTIDDAMSNDVDIEAW